MDNYYRRYRFSIATTFSSNSFESTFGLFDPLTFVVRFSQAIKNALETAGSRLSAISWSKSELLSVVVYLHETIHWWQYIGTTFGFTEALSAAVQGASARWFLQKWSDQYGPRKPTTAALRTLFSKGGVIAQTGKKCH